MAIPYPIDPYLGPSIDPTQLQQLIDQYSNIGYNPTNPYMSPGTPPPNLMPIDPTTGQPIDPSTGLPLGQSPTSTGQPSAGAPPPASPSPFDPITGMPATPTANPLVGPPTGGPGQTIDTGPAPPPPTNFPYPGTPDNTLLPPGVSFQNTNDPRALAANQREITWGKGDALNQQAQDQMAQAQALANSYAGSMDPTISNMIAGGGGYTPTEQNNIIGASQGTVDQLKQGLNNAIDPTQLTLDPTFAQNYLMTPQQQQDIITKAGISAGGKDYQAISDMERQAAAAGTDPLGVAAMRQSYERQAAADAGDAMTSARIAASNAAAQRQQTEEAMRESAQQYLTGAQMQAATTGGEAGIQQGQFNTGVAQNIANTRLNQQNTGLQARSAEQAQANQNVQTAGQRQQQTYGTQTGSAGTAAGLGLSASQTPSTWDKIMGGISGGLSAVGGFLGEGGIVTKPGVYNLGEKGPEMVVPINSRRKRPNMDDQEVPAAPPPRVRRSYGAAA